MNHPFDPVAGIIRVQARLQGPSKDAGVFLALDTGASVSVLSRDILTFVGYDLTVATVTVVLTTGSAVVKVPRIEVQMLEALGQQRPEFALLAHTLPPSVSIDGVLGLDFFRGLRVVLDFRQGLISLD